MFTLLYIAGTIFCLLDKGSDEKEFIVDKDPVDIERVYFDMKAGDNPKIDSNDKGFFGRAFKDKYENGFWGEYDVFLPMVFTTIATSILWLITSIMDIYKYYNVHWSLACHVLLTNTS